MRAGPAVPAKITPPRVDQSIPRAGLWQRLDEGLSRLVWVQAPAGHGKTMAVAGWFQSRQRAVVWYRTDEGDGDPATVFGYLAQAVAVAMPVFTADYQLGLPAFGRRWFERWWAALLAQSDQPVVLVFDDFQEAGAQGLHLDLLRCALEAMPAQATLVVLSRQLPPRDWARLQASEQLVVVDAAQVNLQPDEAQALARLRAPGWSALAHRRVSEACQGWAVGLVLLMQEGAQRWDSVHHDRQRGEALHAAMRQPEQLQDYWAQEVINRLPAHAVPILQAAAWLPVALVDVLQDLLPTAPVRDVLEQLHRSGTFTLKVDRRADTSEGYQFHPLFLDCLRSEVVQGPDVVECQQRQWAVAMALEARGHREDALQVALSSGHWEQACRWLMQLRPVLAAQGRQRTLLRWLSALPEPLISQQPWLVFTRGEGRCLLQQWEGIDDLQRARDLFVEQQDHRGHALTLAMLSMPLRSKPDINPGLIRPVFEELAQLEAVWQSDDLMERAAILDALASNRWFSDPCDPRITHWLDELRRIAERVQTPFAWGMWLVPEFLQSLAQGHHDRVLVALRVLDETEADLRSEQTRAFFRFLRVYALNRLGRFDESVAAFEAGASAAAGEGAVIWAYQISMHGVEACVGAGRIAQAQALLDGLQRQVPVDRGFAGVFHALLAGWLAMARGDLEQALLECQRLAQRLPTADVALFHTLAPLTLGWVQLARGELDAADLALQAAEHAAKKVGSPLLEFDALLALSEVAHRRGDRDRARRLLAHSLRLGRVHRYITVYYARPRDLSSILARALVESIEPDYVRHFIRARGLPAPDERPVDWVWPLRIRTFGPFAIERESEEGVEALRFGAKTPKRLLQLLKAVMALGHQGVAHENRVMDAVWPELEADQAQSALKVAVSRLNQLLGEPGGWLVQRGGQLVLDRNRMWVDLWALEALDTDQAAEVSIDAIRHYRGAFLSSDLDLAWLGAARQRWRQRVASSVAVQAQQKLDAQEVEGALQVCMELFDRDPLVEPVAILAMRCLAILGRRLEGVAVYDRLSDALGRELGLRPAQAAQALHRDLLKG